LKLEFWAEKRKIKGERECPSRKKEEKNGGTKEGGKIVGKEGFKGKATQ